MKENKIQAIIEYGEDKYFSGYKEGYVIGFITGVLVGIMSVKILS
jgi:hypothetical protein